MPSLPADSAPADSAPAVSAPADSAPARSRTPLSDAIVASHQIARSERQQRLLSWFSQDVPLLIVHGPPGSGKSEFLADWALSHSVQATVHMTAPFTAGRFADVLRSRSSTIIIDEVDEELPKDLERMLFAEIKDRPDRQFLISGRHTRNLEERAHRARIKSAIRFGDDLLATVSELGELAHAWGDPRDPAHIRHVHDMTGGWLEPARLILRDSSADTLLIDSAKRWLKSVTFEIMSPGELALLDRASLLTRIDEESITLVSSERDPDGGLPSLHDRGLVRRDGDGRWMVASPLVRSVLDERARARAPSETDAIHAAIAAAAYARDPMRFARQILDHARRGKAWSVLERFWTEHGSAAMAQLPRETQAAFAGIPDHIMNQSTTLAVAAAFSTTSVPDEGVLERLDRYGFQHSLTISHIQGTETTDAFVERTVIRLLQLRRSGKLAEANELSAAAEREVERRVTSGSARPTAANSALLLIQHAVNRMLTDNDGASAAEFAGRALEYARASKHDSLTSTVLGYLAVLRAANGWSSPPPLAGPGPRFASAPFSPGHDIARAMADVDMLDREQSLIAQDRAGSQTNATEFWPLAALAQSRHFLFFEAAEDLDDYYHHLAWTYPSARDEPSTGRMILEWSGVLADLRAGRLAEAEHRVAAAQDESSWMSVLTARLHLSTFEHEAALTEIAAATANDTLGNRERAQLLFMGAASSLMLGKEQQATVLFRQARSLADAHNLRSTYLAISRDHRAELLGLAGETLPRDTAARLDELPDAFPERVPPVALSGREMQVLHGLASGASHREVATALFISVPTVRSHVRTLYAKLQASDSVTALGRAAELGLLLATDVSWDWIRALHGNNPARP